MTHYHAAKTRIKEDAAMFLSRFIQSEVSGKWYYATRAHKDESREEWAGRIARSLAKYQFALVMKGGYAGDNKHRFRWWRDVRGKAVSLDSIGDPAVASRIVWICADTFVDPRYAEARHPSIMMNTIFNVNVPNSEHDLSRIVTAWLRLQRTALPETITEAAMLDELADGVQRRRAYAQRREEERYRAVRQQARGDPEAVIALLRSEVDPEKVWKAMHIYAERPRSAFHKAILKTDARQSIGRAVALGKRGEIAHRHAQLVDYHFRLIPPAHMSTYGDLRNTLIEVVKDKALPNRKLTKILAMLTPKDRERLDDYSRFLHDLNGVLRNIYGLPPSLYAGELLNALNSRGLADVGRDLSILAQAAPNVRNSVLAEHPKSLRRAASAAVAVEQADLVTSIKDKAMAWRAVNIDRLLDNALHLGVAKEIHGLLSTPKTRVPRQLMPDVLSERIDEVGVTVEFSNMSVVDGWMAMALPEICVRFAGHEHVQQFECEAGYLCVYDDDALALGGFLVDAGDYILMNNLQGGLGNRLNKSAIRKQIAHAIEKVLTQLGKPVALRNLVFNSFSLVEELKLAARDLKLDLPNIYLDNPAKGDYFILGTRRQNEEEQRQERAC